MRALFDPKNDFVFKKLFVKRSDLLADLINAVRSGEAPVEIVEVFNPAITPEDLNGKFIVLDVLVRDTQGQLFNVEMQVRFTSTWIERSLHYLASAYIGQLKRGHDYARLKPVIGIDLLDFDLFEGEQAHWQFQLRDDLQAAVALDLIQLHVLELRKLDRYQPAGTLKDWVTFFRHWHEDSIMSEIRHPPVQEALEELKQLSMDDENYWRVRTRERALHDEAMFMNAARKEGIQIGEERGRTALLTRQLTLKFGELSASAQQRLQQATEAELDTWAERILFAAALDDVFQ